MVRESQANIVQHEMKCGDIRHLFMRDPTLTELGKQKSIESQETAPDADIIISSQLLRAIQTGLWTYPKRFIHVVPYLNELGGGLDNSPHDKEQQKEHFNETPDIVTFGKGIASGFSLAGVVSNDDNFKNIQQNGLGGTYNGNVLCTSAANATLDVFNREDLIGNAILMGEYISERVNAINHASSTLVINSPRIPK